jgi:hypothetical protein
MYFLYMPSNDLPVARIELARLLAEERRHDATRRDIHRREADRYSGVAWSAMGPDPLLARSPQQLEADALSRQADLATWRASPQGRLVAAVAAAQRAASQAHSAGESIRAAVNRGFDAEREACISAASILEREGRRLLASALIARRSLRPHN